MPTGRAGNGLGRLRAALLPPDGGALSDGQLLDEFLARRDGVAFAAIVRRHGPMVLGVCRRVLRHAHDAEDAFQATFLVLARKAASVGNRGALGGWLYRVALRTALAARAADAGRRARERQVADVPHPGVTPPERGDDLTAALDRELDRLPEKYRLPVVLCELEGRPRREVARRLGLPEGTLSSRLASARQVLRQRLAKYAPELSAAALGTVLAEGASAAVPKALVRTTVQAASGAVHARVAALAEGVVKTMFLAKLKASAGAFLLAVSVSAGAVGFTYRTASAEGPPAASQSIRDELDALRLEVEALRKGQQATRARVKELEAEVGTLRAQANAGSAGRVELHGVNVGDALSTQQGLTYLNTIYGAQHTWNVAHLVDAPTASLDEAEAALKKLRQSPGDKEALAALEKAVRSMRGEGKKGSGSSNAQPARP